MFSWTVFNGIFWFSRVELKSSKSKTESCILLLDSFRLLLEFDGSEYRKSRNIRLLFSTQPKLDAGQSSETFRLCFCSLRFFERVVGLRTKFAILPTIKFLFFNVRTTDFFYWAHCFVDSHRVIVITINLKKKKKNDLWWREKSAVFISMRSYKKNWNDAPAETHDNRKIMTFSVGWRFTNGLFYDLFWKSIRANVKRLFNWDFSDQTNPVG